jgi:hypothetical protein
LAHLSNSAKYVRDDGPCQLPSCAIASSMERTHMSRYMSSVLPLIIQTCIGERYPIFTSQRATSGVHGTPDLMAINMGFYRGFSGTDTCRLDCNTEKSTTHSLQGLLQTLFTSPTTLNRASTDSPAIIRQPFCYMSGFIYLCVFSVAHIKYQYVISHPSNPHFIGVTAVPIKPV